MFQFPFPKQQTLAELERFSKDYIIPAAAMGVNLDLLTGDKYEVWAKPDISTACTYFDHDKNRHVIFIGSMLEEGWLNTEKDIDRARLVEMLLFHEVGHVLYSDKNDEEILKKLKEKKVPHRLWNLGEDVYIEAKLRKKIGDEIGRPYYLGRDRWTKYANEGPNMPPEAILFNFLNSEGKKQISGMLAFRVEDYFYRLCDAKDTFEVIDIMGEWINEFHDPKQKQQQQGPGQPQQGQGQSQQQQGEEGKEGEKFGNQSSEAAMDKLEESLGEGMGNSKSEDDPSQEDVFNQGESQEAGMSGNESGEEHGIANQSNPQAKSLRDQEKMIGQDGRELTLDEMKEGALLVTGGDRPSPMMEGKTKFKLDNSEQTKTIASASTTEKIFKHNKGSKPEYFKSAIKKIVSLLSKIKDESKSQKYATRKPSNKLNTKGIPGLKTNPGSTKLYKRKREQKNELRDKKITFILDLSSSMSGLPVKNQRTLLLAANRLAKKFNKLDIVALGAMIGGGYRQGTYQTIKLPANEDDLVAIQATGGTGGIANALKENKSLFKQQDIAVFITDGYVIPQEVSKKYVGEYFSKECVFLGAYMGAANTANPIMKKEEWFDHLIEGEDIVEVVEQLVEHINNPQKAPKKIIQKSENISENSNLRKNSR